MAGRRLNPDEKQLWSRVAATIVPLAGRRLLVEEGPLPTSSKPVPKLNQKASVSAVIEPQKPTHARPYAIANTLDGGWDKRLKRGLVRPERSIDLHGHNAAQAHARLSMALNRAQADGVRVLLVITGKPRADSARMPPATRGIIRASILDWITCSTHSSHIAAIRNAHPRHGGDGALYVIFRSKAVA